VKVPPCHVNLVLFVSKGKETRLDAHDHSKEKRVSGVSGGKANDL